MTTDERWADAAPYWDPDGDTGVFPTKEFPKETDVKDWLLWSDPATQAIITGPNSVEVHGHEDERCPATPCTSVVRIMAWHVEITDEGWVMPPDRCDMSAGVHSTPHRGCVLR